MGQENAKSSGTPGKSCEKSSSEQKSNSESEGVQISSGGKTSVEDEDDKSEVHDDVYVMVLPEDRSPMLFTLREFDLYFDHDGTFANVNRKKHTCGTGVCQCKRWDSFICNHTLNHAKCTLPSCFSLGRWTNPQRLAGVFLLHGSVFGTSD